MTILLKLFYKIETEESLPGIMKSRHENLWKECDWLHHRDSLPDLLSVTRDWGPVYIEIE